MQFPYLDWFLPASYYMFQNPDNPNATKYKPQAFVGKPAPGFETDALVNGKFRRVNLNDYKGKYVVLFFYPLDHTFQNPYELQAFNEAIDKFRNNNCEVLACSVDSKYSHLEWVKKPEEIGGIGNLKYPLLSDLTHVISKKYGVYLENEGVDLKGTFIADKEGILRHASINDLPLNKKVDETYRVFRALQHSDNNNITTEEGWWPEGDEEPKERKEPQKQEIKAKVEEEKEEEEEEEEYVEEYDHKEVVVKQEEEEEVPKQTKPKKKTQEKEEVDLKTMIAVEEEEQEEVVEYEEYEEEVEVSDQDVEEKVVKSYTTTTKATSGGPSEKKTKTTTVVKEQSPEMDVSPEVEFD